MLALTLAVALAVAPTSLTVTVWPQGRDAGHARTWTLRCDPAGGTLPRAAQACRRLASQRAPFAPTPRGTACSEVYGGPQEALVRGRYRGRVVWARFGRRNGCEISRWNRIRLLFPVPVGAT